MLSQIPTILLVDDSAVNLLLLQDILKRYTLLTASNGPDAIRLALSDPKPDLILLDIIMPGMDGYEVCDQLKHNDKTKDIPIIFITGQAEADSIARGFEKGAVDYITKPFKIEELRARVKTQVSIKIARDQNAKLVQKIEEINKKLTDSIAYAQKIQNASLPKLEFMDRILPEYFVLLKPRDIVSGDFYWVSKVNGKIVVVAADCTGHGVPGAIMSMFGVAYLYQIVGVNGESNPAEILNQLRSIIIDALQQTEESEVKDGMDMSVVTIDVKDRQLQFAGAFNPLFLVREGKMLVYPSDSMPVSYGEINRSFNCQSISYQAGDCIYLFSDGFASQFGGERGKKLKQVGFRQLVLENSALPMVLQREAYDAFFETWRGDYEQIDDVLLIGIRL